MIVIIDGREVHRAVESVTRVGAHRMPERNPELNPGEKVMRSLDGTVTIVQGPIPYEEPDNDLKFDEGRYW